VFYGLTYFVMSKQLQEVLLLPKKELPPIMNKENGQTTFESVLKLTAMIPALGVLLYSFGWNYWSSYFENLGIPVSLISLSIETVIVTTWKFTVGAIFLTNFVLIDFFKNRRQEKFDIPGSLFAVYVAF